MLTISSTISIPEKELQFRAIRAQGPGGQHVNKTSSAIHLRFDFLHSASLPEFCKERLLSVHDRRIRGDGIIVIKAQNHRSLEKNRQDARKRLADIILAATSIRPKRRPTKPSRASQHKRLAGKIRASRTKQLRKKVGSSEF